MTEKTHRHDVAVLHPEKPELLLLSSGALPGFRAASSWLAPADLVDGVGLPLPLIMLDTLHHRPDGEGARLLHAFAAQQPGPLPESARWAGMNELNDHPDGEALRHLLMEDAGLLPLPDLRPAWARRGWLSEVKAWMAAELARLDRTPVGDPEQLKHWSLAAVLRQPTDAGPVYFKATMTPRFAREGSVTRLLAGLFPQDMPEALAHDAARGWLLLAPFPKDALNDADLETQAAAMRRHAEVQLEAVNHLGALLAAGCEDRRLTRMRERLPALLRESLELSLLTDAEREALLALEDTLLVRMDALAACGLPETLLHGDLHLGNVAHAEGRFTFFDWTDAAVGHPFFDLITLHPPWTADEAWPALQTAYLAPWQARCGERPVAEALNHALVLGRLFHAESYEAIYRAQEPRARWSLRGTAAFHLRQLLAASGARA
jgi:hypothetical protein